MITRAGMNARFVPGRAAGHAASASTSSGRDMVAVHAAQQVLEQHADRVGQAVRVDQPVETVDDLAAREPVAGRYGVVLHMLTRYQA